MGTLFNIIKYIKRKERMEVHASSKWFIAFCEQHIKIVEKERTEKTLANYQCALRSFEKFLGYKDITFDQFTPQLLKEYAEWLEQQKLKPNSISAYMRVLRTIYYRAEDAGVAPHQPTLFKHVYTGVDNTLKRAVAEEVIKELFEMELSDKTALALARDVFLFSFFMRGMAFVDVAHLRLSNVDSEYVVRYTRSKTKQRITVKMPQPAIDIMERYSGLSDTYVLPLIKTKGSEEGYKNYESAISNYNRLLKCLEEKLTTPCKLTSYVARHSWASISYSHDMSIKLISEGLGHSNERTTQIYIKQMGGNAVDKANTELLSFIK